MENHKLTDFFARKSQLKTTDVFVSVNGQRPDQDVSSSSLASTTMLVADVSNPPSLPKPRTRTVLAAVEIVSPRTSEKHHSQHPANRSCSPEIRRTGTPESSKRPLTTPRLPAKRKKKFDSDSDVEPLNTIVYVQKTRQTASTHNTPIRDRFGPLVLKENQTKARHAHARISPHKMPPLSSPDPLAAELVPGSQSDEQEMVLPKPIKKDAKDLKDSINKWRESTSPDTLSINEIAQALDYNMDVDVESPSPIPKDSPLSLSSSLSEADDCARLETITANASGNHPSPSQATLSRQRTPGPLMAKYFSVPATPMVLDAESKAAQIIAQIKADAFAAANSSPEPSASELRPLDESSDDGSPLDSPFVHPAGRYNFRNQASSSLSSITSVRSHSRSKYPKRTTRANTKSTHPPQSNVKETDNLQVRFSGPDPLEILLREKKIADKRGKGTEALILAESTMAGKFTMRGEMATEDDWTNEQAALTAVCEGGRLGLSSCSPDRSPCGSDYLALRETDRERLLGSNSGKAVTNILEGDRATRAQTRGKDKVLGIALWDVAHGEIEDKASGRPNSIPTGVFSDSEAFSIFWPFKNVMERGDAVQATLLLNSGIIATIGPSKAAGIVSGLFELALSVHETSLGESAFHVLLHLWRDGDPATVTIPLTLVWTTLARLGAKLDVFIRMEWTVATGVQDVNVSVTKRTNIIYRLVSLLTASARAGGIHKDDKSDILIILLLIGMDQSTPKDLKTDLMVAVDVVCESLAPGDEVCADVEASTLAKLIKLASNLTPINKAHLLSFMMGSHARTRRLARYLAYGLLVGEEVIFNEGYGHLPSLVSLYKLLAPSAISVGPFSVQELTDYENMGYYVDILAVVLSDIDAYVVQERSGGPATRDLERGGKEKPLEVIRAAIDGVNARIADTRAAHLERSRTKAVLHRLSMRIFYQRLAALKSNQEPRNLRDHWSSR